MTGPRSVALLGTAIIGDASGCDVTRDVDAGSRPTSAITEFALLMAGLTTRAT